MKSMKLQVKGKMGLRTTRPPPRLQFPSDMVGSSFPLAVWGSHEKATRAAEMLCGFYCPPTLQGPTFTGYNPRTSLPSLIPIRL